MRHGTPQITPLLQPSGKLRIEGRVPEHVKKFDSNKSKRTTIECYTAPGDREEVRPRTSSCALQLCIRQLNVRRLNVRRQVRHVTPALRVGGHGAERVRPACPAKSS